VPISRWRTVGFGSGIATEPSVLGQDHLTPNCLAIALGTCQVG
jgi:hypothetical protein